MSSGGWHFTFIMTPEGIKGKIESYAHRQYDQDYFKTIEYINKKIASGEDIFNRSDENIKCLPVPIDESYPLYLQENNNKYTKYIAVQ